MQILDSKSALLNWRANRSNTLAFVPTMGNLHAGHLSLVEIAKQQAEQVLVSIYVNPSQFGVNEDWQRYPRTLTEDLDLLTKAGADFVWLPDEALLYSFGLNQMTHIEVPALDGILCGHFRPGHFSGVATVVSKLFNWIQPNCAIFGEKDYQQLLVIRRLCDEMGYPLSVIAAPTARAPDGLAMSSRNQYLSDNERQLAPEIFKTLWYCRQQLLQASFTLKHYTELCEHSIAHLTQQGFVVDYFEIRRQQDLDFPRDPQEPCIILTAARLGATRLIDNLKV
jgi:pantoate--beta-alanine ligase